MQVIEGKMLIYGSKASILGTKHENGVIAMDMDKFIFKTKFRLSKIKAFFRLCKYTFIQKFHLAPGEGFALHLITDNLRTLLRTSAEHEYLEVHGLLP